MKVDPTGQLSETTPRPDVPRAEPKPALPPADQVEISGSTRADATYGRGAATPSGSSPEVSMASDARAQRLAEIRSRVESGAYNSREMIEKVVDRLLSSWRLGSKGNPDANA